MHGDLLQNGCKLSSGQLEITETDLVFHQKGKQPIKWPLKYLKRYTFGAGLFSFEAGRKNPTGPGIYAFKCRRAENLFNLLQVRVRNSGPGSNNTSVTLSSPSGETNNTVEEPATTPAWTAATTNLTYSQTAAAQDNVFFPATGQPRLVRIFLY